MKNKLTPLMRAKLEHNLLCFAKCFLIHMFGRDFRRIDLFTIPAMNTGLDTLEWIKAIRSIDNEDKIKFFDGMSLLAFVRKNENYMRKATFKEIIEFITNKTDNLYLSRDIYELLCNTDKYVPILREYDINPM